MSFEIVVALIGFSLVTSLTPGPNNIMLLSSGVNFGFKRTIPHMLGVITGFPILVFAVGFGLGAVLDTSPQFFVVLKYIGGAYLLFLAYKIATSGPLNAEQSVRRPMSYFAAALFQWVNPKAWVTAISAVAAYSDLGSYFQSVAIIISVFIFVSIISVTTWTGFGTGVRALLSNPDTLRKFNYSMAALLVLSLWPMLR